MAKGKPTKGKAAGKGAETGSAGKPAQYSEEFMKSMQKTYQEALAAAAKSRKEIQSSDEVKNASESGRKAGEVVAGLYECNQIVDKLKKNPATVSMTYVRDVMTEYKVEGISQKDQDLLSKYNMSFPRITKVTKSSPLNFRSFGDAYIKRGGRKIPLQKDGKDDPLLIIEDGDIIGTSRNSYAFEISDSSTCKPDGWENRDYSTDIMLFPESEMRLSIRTKITEPEFSEGMNVHPATTKTDLLSGIELLKGLFRIRLTREKSDVNKLVKISSNYPDITFRPGMAAAAGMYDDVINKLKSSKMSGVQAAVMEKMMAQYADAKSSLQRNTSITDSINTFIELNGDGSLTVFGGNQIKHNGTGKETKTMVSGPKPIKITVTASGMYATDTAKRLDPRVELAMKKDTALTNYKIALNFKAEQTEREEKERKGQGPQKTSAKSQMEEARQNLATAEEIGDKELIEMAKEGVNGAQNFANEGIFEKMDAVAEEGMRKAREMMERFERESKPILDAALPPYNSPDKSDVV